jgi:hypothetical protein
MIGRTSIEFLTDEKPTPDTAVSPATKQTEEPDSEIGEHENPTIKVGGYKLDVDSLIVCFLAIFIWVLVWATSGLFGTLKYDFSFIVIFFTFIIYMFVMCITSGFSAGNVIYELNILLNVEQMIAILYGTMILFALFNHNLYSQLGLPDTCKPVVFKLIMNIVLILTLSSLWINVFTSGRSFRALRKFKQAVYNISLTLFVIICLIFIKNKECR